MYTGRYSSPLSPSCFHRSSLSYIFLLNILFVINTDVCLCKNRQILHFPKILKQKIPYFPEILNGKIPCFPEILAGQRVTVRYQSGTDRMSRTMTRVEGRTMNSAGPMAEGEPLCQS